MIGMAIRGRYFRNKRFCEVASKMPELSHWPDRSQPFDYTKSQAALWLASQPGLLAYLFKKACSLGVIEFDEAKKVWRGVSPVEAEARAKERALRPVAKDSFFSPREWVNLTEDGALVPIKVKVVKVFKGGVALVYDGEREREVSIQNLTPIVADAAPKPVEAAAQMEEEKS